MERSIFSVSADSIARIVSRNASPFWQFVKYGVVGALSTFIQVAIFYACASLLFKCLEADDIAVRYLNLPFGDFKGNEPWYMSRGFLAAVNTAIGFVVANIFCWLMNRAVVFTPGKFAWYKELLLFFGASTFATLIALGLMKVLIDAFGMMTTMAVVIEIVVSFFVNFIVRKFYIFKK
jgi:putative flippase GtrA